MTYLTSSLEVMQEASGGTGLGGIKARKSDSPSPLVLATALNDVESESTITDMDCQWLVTLEDIESELLLATVGQDLESHLLSLLLGIAVALSAGASGDQDHDIPNPFGQSRVVVVREVTCDRVGDAIVHEETEGLNIGRVVVQA